MKGSEKQIKWAKEILSSKNANELKMSIKSFVIDEKKSNADFSDEERELFNIVSDMALDIAMVECESVINEIMEIEDSGFWIDNRDYKLNAIIIKKFSPNPFKPAAAIISDDANWLLGCV